MRKVYILLVLMGILCFSTEGKAAKIEWNKIIPDAKGWYTSVYRQGDSLLITYEYYNYKYLDGDLYPFKNFGMVITNLEGNVLKNIKHEETLDIKRKFLKIHDGEITLFTQVNNPRYEGSTLMGGYLYKYRNEKFEIVPDTSRKPDAYFSLTTSAFFKGSDIYTCLNSNYPPERDIKHDSAYIEVYDGELNHKKHILLDKKSIPFEYAIYTYLWKHIYLPNDNIVGIYFGPENPNPNLWSYAILTCFNLEGEFVWAKKLEDKDYVKTSVETINLMSDGHFWVFGYRQNSSGENFQFITETDAEGNELWTKYFKYEKLYRGEYTRLVPCADDQLMAVCVDRANLKEEPGVRNVAVHFFDRTGELVDSVLINNHTWSSASNFCLVPGTDNKGVVVCYYSEDDASIYLTSVLPDIVSVEAPSVPQLFEVYPNPASDELNISFSENSTYTLRLVDELGNDVLKSEVKNQTSATLDISKLAKGFYILEVVNSDGHKSNKKVIIN
jgi:Secretion system C-terminal sorting domain